MNEMRIECYLLGKQITLYKEIFKAKIFGAYEGFSSL